MTKLNYENLYYKNWKISIRRKNINIENFNQNSKTSYVLWLIAHGLYQKEVDTFLIQYHTHQAIAFQPGKTGKDTVNQILNYAKASLYSCGRNYNGESLLDYKKNKDTLLKQLSMRQTTTVSRSQTRSTCQRHGGLRVGRGFVNL